MLGLIGISTTPLLSIAPLISPTQNYPDFPTLKFDPARTISLVGATPFPNLKTAHRSLASNSVFGLMGVQFVVRLPVLFLAPLDLNRPKQIQGGDVEPTTNNGSPGYPLALQQQQPGSGLDFPQWTWRYGPGAPDKDLYYGSASATVCSAWTTPLVVTVASSLEYESVHFFATAGGLYGANMTVLLKFVRPSDSAMFSYESTFAVPSMLSDVPDECRASAGCFRAHDGIRAIRRSGQEKSSYVSSNSNGALIFSFKLNLTQITLAPGLKASDARLTSYNISNPSGCFLGFIDAVGYRRDSVPPEFDGCSADSAYVGDLGITLQPFYNSKIVRSGGSDTVYDWYGIGGRMFVDNSSVAANWTVPTPPPWKTYGTPSFIPRGFMPCTKSFPAWKWNYPADSLNMGAWPSWNLSSRASDYDSFSPNLIAGSVGGLFIRVPQHLQLRYRVLALFGTGWGPTTASVTLRLRVNNSYVAEAVWSGINFPPYNSANIGCLSTGACWRAWGQADVLGWYDGSIYGAKIDLTTLSGFLPGNSSATAANFPLIGYIVSSPSMYFISLQGISQTPVPATPGILTYDPEPTTPADPPCTIDNSRAWDFFTFNSPYTFVSFVTNFRDAGSRGTRIQFVNEGGQLDRVPNGAPGQPKSVGTNIRACAADFPEFDWYHAAQRNVLYHSETGLNLDNWGTHRVGTTNQAHRILNYTAVFLTVSGGDGVEWNVAFNFTDPTNSSAIVTKDVTVSMPAAWDDRESSCQLPNCFRAARNLKGINHYANWRWIAASWTGLYPLPVYLYVRTASTLSLTLQSALFLTSIYRLKIDMSTILINSTLNIRGNNATLRSFSIGAPTSGQHATLFDFQGYCPLLLFRFTFRNRLTVLQRVRLCPPRFLPRLRRRLRPRFLRTCSAMCPNGSWSTLETLYSLTTTIRLW